ncbi:HCP-like protein [Dioscorea alata]|uniref:HCP-like protein n=1 Tax=Dioscorea alata TaxID=55571 RepID=A0ACB7U4G2_DIOAL|nr:HCP-like protein [Dioscorea alata]
MSRSGTSLLGRRAPTHPICLSILHSCTSMSEFLQIHALMLRIYLMDDPFAANKALEFCAASPHGSLHHARKLFDQIPQPNTFAYNTLIRAYANSPFPAMSLRLFSQMLFGNAVPNSYTCTFLLKACARLSAIGEGEQLHGFMIKSGFGSDLFSTNGLVSMYASCGRIEFGRRLFDLSVEKDEVCWNSMISGYAECGLLDHARSLFDEMPERGIISWNAMINGYVKVGDIGAARELFDRMPGRNADSWNTLIAGYAKCGFVDMSRKLFDEMPEKNVVSWSAMITALVQGGFPKEALDLYEEMRRAMVSPNWATIVSVLSACSQLGALERGMHVHAFVERNKMEVDSVIGTALIDMFAKCGCIDRALKIFDKLSSKDVFSWTAMIGGLAVNGHGAKALEFFGKMEEQGVRPNGVTFVGVLCACSHAGRVLLAKRYFHLMSTKYGIEPQVEHYGCMVDALGRAGLIQEAISLAQSSPGKVDPELWVTLLGACWIHGDVNTGEYVLEQLVKLKPDDGGVYVLLSNIYATRGQWDDARRLRWQMKSKGLEKVRGRSSIEINGLVHEFYVGDKSHPRTVEIYQMLADIHCRLRLAGYVPNTNLVLFDIAEEDKENVVAHHSEKLAIAFGMISLNPKAAIRVVKNLRVCLDCHTVAKLISKLYKREIILRDRHVFHYFRDGSCSCKDYW